MTQAIARRPMRTRRLNIRATESQEELIRTGANTKGVSVTDFILESACLQAEQTIADQREFVLSPKRWQAFIEALDRPAGIKPGLVRLFAEARGKKRGSRK
ncbi:MAG TPA: DUF1778 domain-containing protein [Candidatus Binatia bacterium]|nr:DUF1778 domain-containing protein [Candidatus Binatia bacterium]